MRPYRLSGDDNSGETAGSTAVSHLHLTILRVMTANERSIGQGAINLILRTQDVPVSVPTVGRRVRKRLQKRRGKLAAGQEARRVYWGTQDNGRGGENPPHRFELFSLTSLRAGRHSQ